MCIKKANWGLERCSKEYQDDALPGYCPHVWDNYLCWPPTAPGNSTFLPCPRVRSNDVTKFAFRICMENGTWAQRPGSVEEIPIGWTNYTGCFNPYVKSLMTRVQASNLSSNDYYLKHKIAEGTRTLEMFGLTLSILSLLMSLIIFYRFRNLQNNRTRIHKNLFIAMSIQVLVRLIVYIDQYIGQIYPDIQTIETTKGLCEGIYILLEYARTVMFMWMFVEGIYLHNMITVTIFQDPRSLTIYYLIGWCSPIILVLIWGILTYNAFYGFVCWSNYNLSGLFWVLEGPRLLVITLNLLFLLNIIRVLVTKLRKSNSTEAQQVRKAVKAAIVLLPLLGITNAIQMIHTPVDKDIIQFAIWSYLTTSLTSFQGFFCSLIYCFLNEEVQLSVKRFYRARKNRIDINRRKSINPGMTSIVQNIEQQDDAVLPLNSPGHYNHGGNQVSPEVYHPGGKRRRRKEKKLSLERGAIDPIFHQEEWSDGELSSHNHVDIEQIVIPMEYYSKAKQGKTNATVRTISSSVEKASGNSTETSSNTTTSQHEEAGSSNACNLRRKIGKVENIFTKINILSHPVSSNSYALGEKKIEVEINETQQKSSCEEFD